jgi:hypothetical protein
VNDGKQTYRAEETPYTRTTYQEEGPQSSKLCIFSRLPPWLACLPTCCRIVPKPDEAGSSARRRTAIPKESIRLRDPESATWLRLGKSKRREMEGSQRHTAWLESMEAERGKMARTRSKMPWVPKR